MKKKVIKQGNNTLTITLPKKWTEMLGLKPGDEIDLQENGKQIILGANNSNESTKATINCENMTERVLRWVLSAAHKSGYDEIEILHQTPKQLKTIHELIKDLYMGFSIVEQTQKRCLLKSISKEVESEFDTILRRAFLITLSMADSTLDLLKAKDYENLSGLITLEHYNNQFTNFCERIINKIGYNDGKKNCFYYVINWNLEKICDDYKYLCEFFPGKKLNINKEILDLFEKVNSFLREYYEIFYKFNINELSVLANKGKELNSEAKLLASKIKNEADFIVLSTIYHLILQTMDFSASYVAINEFKD
jgi:phosphate uptake regulator